jgi:uncharacterized protein YjbJ (UPF0337 family)
MEAAVKMIIRLVVLALSAYGAWKLYEEYGDRIPALRQSADDFAGRTSDATQDAAQRVGYAADDATSAIRDSAGDIRDAAKDAQERMTRTLQEKPAASTRPSY